MKQYKTEKESVEVIKPEKVLIKKIMIKYVLGNRRYKRRKYT